MKYEETKEADHLDFMKRDRKQTNIALGSAIIGEIQTNIKISKKMF